MDGTSPPTAAAASVTSISDDLKNQSLENSSKDSDCSMPSSVSNVVNKGISQNRVKLKLEELKWDNSFVRELPGDPRTDLTPRQVLHACYTKVSPSVEIDNPQLVAWSDSVAEFLDLDPEEFERPDFPVIFSGASTLVGSIPYAQCYGGHQFGTWAGQLGDGRAITLGEVLNSKSQRWELQLKGAGKTPYSRFADGLAVLRSSIREFLCSEAMHSLGIPTTRALCLVTTGKYVTRDMFYDGNPKDEPGAIVCRVAQSFIRFGSYQIHASRGKNDIGLVRTLADYCIKYHFAHLENLNRSDSLSFSTGVGDDSVVDLTSNKYAAWAVEISERTASLVAKWQGIGFTHGVLNTDNMSVLGLTIDYGPFGFLDAFDPSYTPNTTDLPGRRYCFANQPDIGLWNIAQFTKTLSAADLINEKEANYAMERYGTKFMDDYQAIMTKKLGLPKYNKQLISELLKNMSVDKVDYTNFFRLLSSIKDDPTIPEDELLIPLKAVLLDIGKERKDAWTSWLKSYLQELSASGISDEERKASMDSVNPKYILRNYLCQSAIDAAEAGNFEEVRRLLKVMERPYDEQPGMEKYARLPPAWAYRPGRGAFPSHPTQNGLIFLPIRYDLPISSQLEQVDAVLHKATDEIEAVEMSSSLEISNKVNFTRNLQELQRCIKLQPECCVIDPFNNILPILDRLKIQQILTGLETLDIPGRGKIRGPRFLKVDSFDEPSLEPKLAEAKLSFPNIVKPQVACGVADAHSMAIVFNVNDYKDLNVPLPAVVQEYVDHSSVIYKFYALGSKIFHAVKKSIPNADTLVKLSGEKETKPLLFDSLKSLPISKEQVITTITQRQIDLELVADAADWLRRILDLTIFGFDVVVQEGTNDHVIVDVNYLPSFKEVPDDVAIPAFWDALREKIVSEKTKIQGRR